MQEKNEETSKGRTATIQDIRWYEWTDTGKQRRRILQYLSHENIWIDVPIVHGDCKPKMQYGVNHSLSSKEPLGYA